MPTALSAIPASAIVPPSIQTAADAAAIAQSPARRSTFSCALPPPGRTRQADLRQQLTGADRGHVGTDVKVLHPDDPLALRLRGSTTRAFAAEHTADRSSGGVRLAQRAADRAAVADDRVGDHGLGVGEQREALGEQLRLEQVDVPRQRADPDLTVDLANV